MNSSHLSFYGDNQISPVRQDIDDFAAHTRRRDALYRHLGILPAFIRGRSVVEVGPGSGHNSLHTASLAPSRYVLVEGNRRGIMDINALFAEAGGLPSWVEIVASSIECFETDEQFDFVFCEGLLSGVPNPEEVLDRLSALTKEGGVMTVTCVDHLSHFSETVRRALAQRLVSPDDELGDKVAAILRMYAPHLELLQGMSRRHDDWVIDNLIHPGSIIPIINIPELVVVLAERFDFYSSSPRFISDWRWYKSIVSADAGFNNGAIEQYWAQAHNLLDHEFILPPRAITDNQRLYDLCTTARTALQQFELTRNSSFIGTFVEILREITADVSGFNELAAEGLSEAAALLVKEKIDPQMVAQAKKFARLFGRGQQYISFSKRGAQS